MIDRDIEEALDLVGMQVDGDDTVATRRLKHVGHKLGTDAHTRLVFPVLTSPTKIRYDSYHLISTGTTSRVNHKQQLHKVVCRRTSGLNKIDAVSAHRLFKSYRILSVREMLNIDLAKLASEMPAYTLCDGNTFATRKNFERKRT